MKVQFKFRLIPLVLLLTMVGRLTYAQSAASSKTTSDQKTILQTVPGRIYFTDHRVETGELKPADTVAIYKLTPKSNLFFIARFTQPLSSFKQKLAPGISTDSLFRIGNFQFTIFINQQEIYRSNLLPGAPAQMIQDSSTLLNRPLIDNLNGQGSWSESFWNRFLANGGDSILSDGPKQLRMEIRAYVNTEKELSGELMASGELKVQVALHPSLNIEDVRLSKPLPYPGIPVSRDRFDHKRIRTLKAAVNAGIFKRINGIVVLKNGKLLIEEYFNGETRSSLHDPRSVGKSFTSTLLGMAIADGYIRDEWQTIGDFYSLEDFSNYSPTKDTVSLHDLLCMNSAFDGNDENPHSPGNEENMYPTADWVKFGLDLPLSDSFHGQWHYFTAGVIMAGDIINRRVPGGLESYADQKLFSALGIVHYQWQYTPMQVPNTAGGIQMSALDFAKYGQLYLNHGRWQGRRLLPEAWVTKTMSRQVPITGRPGEFYGYLFWNKTFQFGNKQAEAFYCAGNGGNYILLFEKEKLLIVITASAYGQSYAHRQVDQMLREYLLPAVLDR